MTESSRAEGVERRKIAAAAGCVILCVYLCLQVRVAAVPIEFYDGFDYLTNAARLAGYDVTFDPIRAPLVSLVNLPQIAFFFSVGPPMLGSYLPLLTAHAIALAMSLALALAALQIYRQAFAEERANWAAELLAWAGVLMLVLNRMVIHYWSFAMADLPLALFVSLSVYGYLRGWRWKLAAAVAGAMLAKYVGLLVPVMLVVMWFGERIGWVSSGISDRRSVERRLRNLIFGIVGGLALFAAAHLLVYKLAYRTEPLSLTMLRKTLMSQAAGDIVQSEPAWEVLLGLWLSSGRAPVILAAIGIVGAALRRREGSWPFGVWLFTWGAFLAFACSHKETRYSSPLLVPLYYFAINGCLAIWQLLGKRATVAIALAVVCGAATIEAGYREFRVFLTCPEYKGENAGRFLAAIEFELYSNRRASPSGRIYWDGPAYAYYPSTYRFYEADEYYYFYHIYTHTISFLARKNVVRYLPGTVLRDGDTLVLNAQQQFYDTRNAPVTTVPLRFIHIRRNALRLDGGIFRLGKEEVARLDGSRLSWNRACEPWLLLLRTDKGWRSVRIPKAAGEMHLEQEPAVLQAEQVICLCSEIGFRPSLCQRAEGLLGPGAFVSDLSDGSDRTAGADFR